MKLLKIGNYPIMDMVDRANQANYNFISREKIIE